MILRNFFFSLLERMLCSFPPPFLRILVPVPGIMDSFSQPGNRGKGPFLLFFYAPYYERPRRSTPIEQIFEQELYLPHSSGRTRGKRGEGGIRDRSMWPGKRGMFVLR